MVAAVLRLLFPLSFMLCLAATPVPVASQEERPDEAQLKAAFLSQIGEFVQWPPEAFRGPGEAFAIGVLGASRVAAELERLAAGRAVQGRPLAVHRLQPGELRGDLRGELPRRLGAESRLHILFVGAEEAPRLPEVLASMAERPVLVVTETPGALEAGSMINCAVEEDRIRFDVALPRAEDAGLRISARLLAMARRLQR